MEDESMGDSMTESDAQRILLIDDERDLHDLLLFNLREAGFKADAEATAADGLRAASKLQPDVIVLDIMLPDLSGIETCRRLRAEASTRDAAVLMLTARGEEFDRLVGFEAGADDYVVKPFSVREVVMRVRALARRVSELRQARKSPQTGRMLRWRGLSLDSGRQQVFTDGVEVTLRPLEYKLIALLMENAGRTFDRSDLLSEVWGIQGEVQTRTVDTHVRRLRERLGTYGDAVETVYGTGYRLRAES
jgi:two-component system phosphate regulon response regulator PhoB